MLLISCVWKLDGLNRTKKILILQIESSLFYLSRYGGVPGPPQTSKMKLFCEKG